MIFGKLFNCLGFESKGRLNQVKLMDFVLNTLWRTQIFAT